MKTANFNQSRGLWWAALVILLLSGGMVYFVRLFTPLDPSTDHTVRLIVATGVLGAGICVIAATARWWMKH